MAYTAPHSADSGAEGDGSVLVHLAVPPDAPGGRWESRAVGCAGVTRFRLRAGAFEGDARARWEEGEFVVKEGEFGAAGVGEWGEGR